MNATANKASKNSVKAFESSDQLNAPSSRPTNQRKTVGGIR